THVHVLTKRCRDYLLQPNKQPTHSSRAQYPATHKPTASTPLGRLRHTSYTQTNKK
ncbi:hypothetical protein COCVIDRAFT_103606, partial [Bipolaris victoriae FI3]